MSGHALLVTVLSDGEPVHSETVYVQDDITDEQVAELYHRNLVVETERP